MSHLSNPLATAQQLYTASSEHALPAEIQGSLRYQTARLTEAAGILLRLPQEVAAQAIVLLQRYWLVDDLLKYEFSDVSASSLFLAAKISAWPRSLRSITNVYAYLLSPHSLLSNPPDTPKPDAVSYYLSDSSYHAARSRVLAVEGQILNALGFNTHVALPHPLAITYLQTLDMFTSAYPAQTGQALARRTLQHLNSALLSPQMLYLTHQPNALAVAAIYLAARETDVKLPEGEWWEVFDVEREELGFLVVGMRSLEGWVREQGSCVGGHGSFVNRRNVSEELQKRGIGQHALEDEEDEMMRLMDEKVTA